MTTAAPPLAYRSSVQYTDRQSKALYIADKYAPILIGSVLDVGCDAAPLRKLVHQPFRYVGVDIRSDADIVVNLDNDPLPFADRQFDTVVCTDVLEHLERCHAVFDDLCRVAAGRVIVSLPNPLLNMVQSLLDGHAGRLKFYGFPVDPPADRHRWFFGYEEAVEFLSIRGRRNGFEVEQLDAEESSLPRWLNAAGQDILKHPNVRKGTIWCVLHRAEHGGPK